MIRRYVPPVLLLALLAPAAWRVARACGPEFVVAVFHYARHPDFPRSRFLDGHLGVLQPTWARSYLVISWRYLTGAGLDPREKQQATDYYKDRATGWWDKTGADWPDRWVRARNRVTGVAHPPRRLLSGGQFAFNPANNAFDLNCAEDAYRTAVNTLDARIRRFGVGSRAVREWVVAQNQVFANCDGAVKSIPATASTDLPVQIQDDRRYQIAAAHFYSGSLEQARDAFGVIARDSRSEWRVISRYLLLRTLLRMPNPKNSDPSVAAAAFDREAEAILSDPKLEPIHAMTDALVSRHGILAGKQITFHRLAQLVASKGQGNGLREGLWNYTTEYDRLIGEADPNSWSPAPDAKADRAIFEGDDLTAWIFHFQSRDPASGVYALAQWKRTRSLPWLLAALRHAGYETASRNGLLDAARAVPPGSPAYETAAWHYYRLILDAKAKGSARAGLDEILASGKLTPSSVRLFRNLRMAAAPDLTDFLSFAAHRPLMITVDLDVAQAGSFGEDDQWTRDLMARYDPKLERLDFAAASVINNELPCRFLQQAAFSTNLPLHLRREFLLTTLTRALILNLDLTQIAARLAETDPALAARAKAIVDAQSEDARRFAAVHLILWQPEARPFITPGISRQTANGRLDDYRENWWCPITMEDPTSERGVARLTYQLEDKPQFLYPVQPARWLLPEQKAEAARERQALIASGRAMDFMGGIVLAWAAKHPKDPRIPEALHREIRGNRITCDGERETKINRQAFRLLHYRYGKTAWARKTTTM